MAKLYFKYGAMGSSKTAQALITKYNYEENDLKVWLIKPGADTRDGTKVARARRIKKCRKGGRLGKHYVRCAVELKFALFHVAPPCGCIII